LSAVRAHLDFRVALRAATFRLRDDGVHAGATAMPAAITLFLHVPSAQQKPVTGSGDVPFGAVFDTKLSRKWNVSPRAWRRGKSFAGLRNG
jgi:hypothetical protein